MVYNIIRRDVERIIDRTRGTSGLGRAAAVLEKELGERALQRAETEEGSGRKGELEQAVSHLEISYQRFPDPKVAGLLSHTLKLLGDAKKECNMPGYEADYEKSKLYEEQSNLRGITHNGSRRNYR